MIKIIDQDFETASEANLKEVGLFNYATHPSTRVLLLAYAIDDGEVKQWEPHKGRMPAELVEAISDPFTVKQAYNCTFERLIYKYVLGIDIPIDEWRDVQVMARYYSLPGYLDDVSKILKLDVEDAATSETELIKLFCEPFIDGTESPLFGRTEAAFKDWRTNPSEWEKFKTYNIRDVRAEIAIARKLINFPVPDHEWKYWFMDQKINDAGLPLDMNLVDGALKVVAKEQAKLEQELKELTGVDNPNSDQQILAWIRERNYPFSKIGKPFVKRALDGEGNITDEARKALILRSQLSKSGVDKFSVFRTMAGNDHNLRHQFSFMGASRTGRYASRGINIQNLTRPDPEVNANLDVAIDLLTKGDYDGITKTFKASVLEVASSCIRPVFRAPAGRTLAISDLNAIEPRVSAWISGCETVLDIYRNGLDGYKMFAVEVFKKPYEEITKEERNLCKPPFLGCFGADTPVLTDNGCKPLLCVSNADKVWDGEAWVPHNGVTYQGYRDVINLFGINVTPEHEILIGDNIWTSACAVTQNSQLEKLALNTGRGLSSNRFTKKEKDTRIISADVTVDLRNQLIDAISKQVKQSLVLTAPEKRLISQWAAFTNSLINHERLSISLPTGITPLYLDVPEKEPQRIDMEVEVSNVDLVLYTNLLDIAYPWIISILQTIKLTDETITDIMSEETFVSFLLRLIREIKKILGMLNITKKLLQPSNSGNDIVLSIEIKELLQESFETVFLPNRLSRIKNSAKEHVYDILDCGKNKRFTIMTNAGPLIVHNCSYRLSGGEEIMTDEGVVYTGLLAYSRARGIELTKEFADKAVAIFRKKYKEIKYFWYTLEDAFKAAVLDGEEVNLGKITFKMVDNTLCMGLPSGRNLHYINPQVEENVVVQGRTGEYTKTRLTHEGLNKETLQWSRQETHGGVLIENATQAIARDVLMEGMRRAEERGLNVRGHVHDELISLIPENVGFTAKDLEDCMAEPIEWAVDLPLKAEGFLSKTYRKN